MANFDITITNKKELDEKKVAYLFDDVVRLEFINEDEYFKFMKNPELTMEDFNIFDDITDTRLIEKITMLPDLSKKIQEGSITVDIHNIKNLPVRLLQTKKKVTLNLIELDFKDTISILKSPYMHKNVYFYDKFNEGMKLSLMDMLNVYEELIRYAKVPLDNNYSPVECFYYIYNLLKQRIYHEEEKNEKGSKSRGLKEVLYGDKIVCVGYSNLFAAIASVLGLSAEVCSWEHINDKNGHASNVVYLNDPKYNICGIYAIDVTWDSKKNDDDEEYENNIKNFLVPIVLEENIMKAYNYKPTFGCSYYRFFISKIYCVKYPQVINNDKMAYKKANIVYQNLGMPLVNESVPLDAIEKELLGLGNKEISTDTLRDIIMTVTPKSEKELDKTIKSSKYYEIESERMMQILQILLGN